MPEPIEIPLHLCQVLEEEFESLHEKLDWKADEDTVPMPDRVKRAAGDEQSGDGGRVRVVVKSDWDFHPDHVRRDLLVVKLGRAWQQWRRAHPGVGEADVSSYAAAENDPATYLALAHPLLREALPIKAAARRKFWGVRRAGPQYQPLLLTLFVKRLRGREVTDGEYLAALRAVLADRGLFRVQRFEHLTTLRDETRGLVGLAQKRGGEAFSDGNRADDLTRFRRLLLEDAFPDEIRRAYDLRLARVAQRVHELGVKRSAVCLSGGGIRSGTFALGVLQSFARRGFLDRFDYLSTVSGGGYIGGWLSAWIHRHPDGLKGVVEELSGRTRVSKLAPEPEPLRHLRDYSNFITPKTGLLSADTWTFVVIYVRNLLLNWVVLVPLLASLLIIPRITVAVILAPPDWWTLLGLIAFGVAGAVLLKPSLFKPGPKGARWGHAVGYALGAAGRLARDLWALVRWRGVGLLVLAGLLLAAAAFGLEYRWPGLLGRAAAGVANTFGTPRGAMLLAGVLLNGYAVSFMRLNRPSNSDLLRPGSFWDRRKDQDSFLWLCLLPLCLSATLLTASWAWYTRGPRPGGLLWEFLSFLAFGAGTGLFGFLFYAASLARAHNPIPAERHLLLTLEEIEKLRAAGEAGAHKLKTKEAEKETLEEEISRRRRAVRHNVLREWWLMLVSNLLGAVLLWAAATRATDYLDHPVVNPFECVPYKDGVGYALLPYTRWWGAEIYATLSFPVYLLVFFLGLTIFVGLTSRRTEKSPAQRQEERARREEAHRLRMDARRRRAAARRRKEAARRRKEAAGVNGPPAQAPAAAAAQEEDAAAHYDAEADPVFSFGRYFIEDEDREWLARASAWLFIVVAGWLFFSALVIFGPLLFFALEKWLLAAGGLSGFITILGGRSAGTPGSKGKSGQQGWRGVLSTLGVNVVVLASFVFFACLVLAVALLTGTVIAWLAQYLGWAPIWIGTPDGTLAGFWECQRAVGLSEPQLLQAGRLSNAARDFLPLLDGQRGEFAGHYPLAGAQEAFRVTHFPSWLYLALLAMALHAVGRFCSRVINLNKFSLHAGYRDRIIRAFLGASRPRGERQANPFTGFDPRDNLNMDELRLWVLRESDFEGPNGLADFVTELARPETQAGAEGDGRAARRAAAALRLHKLLEKIEGDSLKFLKRHAPESIEANASFRSALFADLSRILQTERLEREDEFKPYLKDAREKYAGLAPRADAQAAHGDAPSALLNRLLLLTAFDDCLKYPPRLHRLMHVVNMALNLVGGDKLAWQHRRAESFTTSALHSGSLFVGYRRTRDYGGKNGISLGTAVAISGAAASSNMGYFSPSPFVTLALTFFNARLGWWLGNPGVHGAETFFRSHPQKALSPILDEAFGLTDDQNPYVLLSDGGHFENLGLYEMVLRRCRNIIVVDGSADPGGTLEGLGDAVRKIRIDLGIRIEFEPPFPILARPRSEERQSGGYCAVGDIHYEDVDAAPPGRGEAPRGSRAQHERTGRLVYIKPTIYGTEPRDIFNYAMSHTDFPHESTADQFFDEPQFESHRMLGFYIVEELFEKALKTKEGASLCASRDLQGFVDWLEGRARRERRAAGGQGGDRPDPAALIEPGLPF
ncbi:MAG TPA: patatin-like phospholipase family protein [Pyrinomonadaceae bacterium]